MGKLTVRSLGDLRSENAGCICAKQHIGVGRRIHSREIGVVRSIQSAIGACLVQVTGYRIVKM